MELRTLDIDGKLYDSFVTALNSAVISAGNITSEDCEQWQLRGECIVNDAAQSCNAWAVPIPKGYAIVSRSQCFTFESAERIVSQTIGAEG